MTVVNIPFVNNSIASTGLKSGRIVNKKYVHKCAVSVYGSKFKEPGTMLGLRLA